ncbi:RICIN domain-containing protein [Streptomyces sp. NPDC089915]|uniref:RICIN domain-containing protein n=1 Tax=Streptomyces sp. NPDC089915 TaxID=3155186 RepID=UPI003434C6D5
MSRTKTGIRTAVIATALAAAVVASAPYALAADPAPGTAGAAARVTGKLRTAPTGTQRAAAAGDVLGTLLSGMDRIFASYQQSNQYKSFINAMLDEVDQDTNYKYNVVVVYMKHDFGAANINTGRLQGGPGVNNTPVVRTGSINNYSYGVFIFDQGTADFENTMSWYGNQKITAYTESNGGIHGNATGVGANGSSTTQLRFDRRSSPSTGGNSMLSAGQTLSKGQRLTSGNGNTLIMQDDGNLVEYGDGGRVLHASGTVGRGDHLTMQWDGNLVLSTANNIPLWSTGTPNNPNAWVQIQDDGNLVLHRSDNSVLWAITPNGWPQTSNPDLGSHGANNNGSRGNHPDGSWITIVNQGSGRAIDDAGGGTADGNRVQTWAQHSPNEPSQGWRLDRKEDTSDGMPAYALTNRVKDGQVLNLSGADNRNTQLYHYDATNNSKWIFVGKGDGWYEIYSANKRNDCLTDKGHGGQVTVEPCNGGAEQRWGTYLY